VLWLVPISKLEDEEWAFGIPVSDQRQERTFGSGGLRSARQT